MRYQQFNDYARYVQRHTRCSEELWALDFAVRRTEGVVHDKCFVCRNFFSNKENTSKHRAVVRLF
ncbi:hypothetical protein BC628DRAFT_287762 [Trametes gibbosa]|nr:hypothetical protein BC628DRAFT_287762 [Trametes gibbosa]